MMLRRQALAIGSALLGALTLGGWTLFKQKDKGPLLLSARDDADGKHYAVGYRLDGQRVFATQVGQRCHDIINHPTLPIALFVARRPGTESYLIDLRDGALLQTITANANRHFYGHAVIHKSGDWLYATENDTSDPGRGLLGVYRFEGERLVHSGEISTHGIGPHQVAWMPDGETLVVANGGIRTEAESRVEMNLNAMEPSLVLMQRDGSLISKETLGQQMNSVRHMGIASDGTILTGQQFMGRPRSARVARDQAAGAAIHGVCGGRRAATGDGALHRQRRGTQRIAPGRVDRTARQPLVYLAHGQWRAAPGWAVAGLCGRGCGGGWVCRDLRPGALPVL